MPHAIPKHFGASTALTIARTRATRSVSKSRVKKVPARLKYTGLANNWRVGEVIALRVRRASSLSESAPHASIAFSIYRSVFHRPGASRLPLFRRTPIPHSPGPLTSARCRFPFFDSNSDVRRTEHSVGSEPIVRATQDSQVLRVICSTQ